MQNLNLIEARAITNEIFVEHNSSIGGNIRAVYSPYINADPDKRNDEEYQVRLFVFKDNVKQAEFTTGPLTVAPRSEEGRFYIRTVVREAITANFHASK
jgi:hypothetical protein